LVAVEPWSALQQVDTARAATDPNISRTGAGFGQALMHSRVDRCDAEHAPAYLDATKQETVPYYMRFGFEVTGEIEAPGGGAVDVPDVAGAALAVANRATTRASAGEG
jgi:predicted N-acetyltransferase YhbS